MKGRRAPDQPATNEQKAMNQNTNANANANGIDRNDDGTHGPEHLTGEEIRTWVNDLLDRSEEWSNYGDCNPKTHGGRFVQFDESADMWRLIETASWSSEEYMFVEYHIEEDDIFVGGDPAKGWTDAMVSIFESFGMSESEYDVTNPEILRRIQYYIVDLPHETRISGEDTYHADYWDALEDKGVNVGGFRD